MSWVNHLEEDQLERQMRVSYCLISPSLMEGFDYPLFEAQALRESLGNAGLSNGGAKKSADGRFVSLLGRNQALDC